MLVLSRKTMAGLTMPVLRMGINVRVMKHVKMAQEQAGR